MVAVLEVGLELHERETHAPRQRRSGWRLEGAFDSSAVAWCYSVLRHHAAIAGAIVEE
jgi:hypothetical protein